MVAYCMQTLTFPWALITEQEIPREGAKEKGDKGECQVLSSRYLHCGCLKTFLYRHRSTPDVAQALLVL